MNFRKQLSKNLVNLPGWRTKRKLVVFESDDWGSIRMPSRKIYELLISKGIPINKHYFLKNDCLESETDLTALFDLLIKYRDSNNHNPIITANAVVANPDFDKIQNAGFREYHYQLITETYLSYPDHAGVLKLWKNAGIEGRLLWPQFHGREHLNIRKWLRALNSGIDLERLAFENKVLLGLNNTRHSDSEYMAAFEYRNQEEMTEIESIVADGLELFNRIFGFRSRSLMPSCSVQGDHLNEVLMLSGVLYNQSGQHYIPIEDGRLKLINYFWGHRNSQNQIYWRRNCTFEPSKNQDYDWVNSCLGEMKIAFRWGKPAVINSHRVNFSGGVFEENRTRTLEKLNLLLKSMLKTWPDIEFVSSDELGDIISGSTS